MYILLFDVLQNCYGLSREFRAHLKNVTRTTESMGYNTFDEIAAHVYRSRVKALDVKPFPFEPRLTFSVNTQSKFKNPPLKEGFYGNVICLACVTSTMSGLVNGSLQDETCFAREAHVRISDE